MKSQAISVKALNRALLARQMLVERSDSTVVDAVGALAGLQAQQPQPPFVGLWTRLARFERDDLARALRDRAIVRATFLRGTLHLARAEDYLGFRSTLQPMLTAGMRSILRDRAATLDVAALTEAARRSFVDRPRTFTELRAELVEAFPDIPDERAMGYAVRTHLPLIVEPDDSAWSFRADADFADAESKLGRACDADEKVEALVLRYLAAFGPATPADFQTWSGLPKPKADFEALRPKLVTFADDRKRELFDLPDAPRPPEEIEPPARFLPGFDNIVLSHDDRSRIVADEHRPKVVTKNLLVLPTILVDGFVAGTWKHIRKKTTATLSIAPFAKLRAPVKKALTEEGERLARFVEPEAKSWEVKFEG